MTRRAGGSEERRRGVAATSALAGRSTASGRLLTRRGRRIGRRRLLPRLRDAQDTEQNDHREGQTEV